MLTQQIESAGWKASTELTICMGISPDSAKPMVVEKSIGLTSGVDDRGASQRA